MDFPSDGSSGQGSAGAPTAIGPDSGLAGIFRACFPRGNLVLSIMHAAASPTEAEDGRLGAGFGPMVAMGGRVPAGDLGRRDEGPRWSGRREGTPFVPNEASHYHSNIAYHGQFGQNELDDRGISRKSRSDQLEKRIAKETNESKELERGKGPKDIRGRAVAKGARAKAHGRSNTSKNERSSLTVEEEIEVSDSEEVKSNDKRAKGGKGSNMKRAIELAKDPRKMMKAKTNFKKRFLAFNTMQSRNSKRRKVLEVMQGITGLEDPFPVNQELLVGVGTALDEAQLQSGDQYAHEVKLMQLEAGYEWTMPMERQLYLVKNALKRHKGPETRASEVKLEDLEEKVWEKKVNGTISHLRPAWSYAFACIWMLRAAEVARVKAKDVTVSFDTKEVVLYIPSSKTDQRGRGAKRTLKCICEGSECSRWCAWALAVRCLAEHRVVDPEAWLFKPAKNLKNPGKAQMVTSWNKHVNPAISGHSARRSGAMYYTRCGMDVAGVSFLGRWKSSAVLRYIEEALQCLPANRKLLEKKALHDPFLKEALDIKSRGDLGGKAHVQTVEGEEEVKKGPGDTGNGEGRDVNLSPEEQAKPPEVGNLWAISTNRSKRTAHVVTLAAWGLSLDSWSTACGWHFAEKCVKVKLTKERPPGIKVCAKCEQSNMVRDNVIGGQCLAQSMAASWSL